MFGRLNSNAAYVITFLVFLLFLFKSYFVLDPDFGWQIRIGELIFKNGIPSTDPFSYTMPSFPYVDHEWFTSVLIYLVHDKLGWVALSILFSLLGLLSILLPFGKKLDKFSILPIVLAGASIFMFVGIRAQVFTWLLFSILIFVFLTPRYYSKFRFLLPPFFIIWANLHGGFVIGLTAFSLYIFTSFFKQKKIDFKDLALLVSSALLTLVNPYGFGLWREVWSSVSDPYLRQAIAEWKPSYIIFYPPLILLIVLSIFSMIKYRTKFSLFEKMLYIGLFAAGLTSVRNLPLWIIIASPFLAKCFVLFQTEIKKIKYGERRFGKAYLFLLFFGILLSVVFQGDIREYGGLRERTYPQNAILYLKKNPSQGQIFSEYGWGGYLIWKYPSKKVFIDGRMPSWRMDKKIPGESSYVFKEYQDLVLGKGNINGAIRKYNIDTFLLPAQLESKRTISEVIVKRIEDKYIKGKNVSLESQLKKGKWVIVYKDKTAVIYRKKD